MRNNFDDSRTPAANGPDPQLCSDDRRLLDALMEAGFDRNALSAVADKDNRRLDAIFGTLGLLRDYPVEDVSETLLHATMARIDRYEDAQATRMNFENEQGRLDGERRGWRIRVPDFITVAAVILIGVGVGWPLMNSMRQQSMKLACENNLRQVGYGFGQYAADYNGALPLAMAGFGRPRTPATVADPKTLVEQGFCSDGHLNCPGHDFYRGTGGNSSYSVRMFPDAAPTGWASIRLTVIAGDMNPLIEAAGTGELVSPLSVSLNHGGRGQNVLWSDGSSLWLERPVVGRSDNIWLPHNTDRLQGGEIPADEQDVFLIQQ